MEVYADALIVYGGVGESASAQDFEYEDTWKFDLQRNKWSKIVQDDAAKPSHRFHHAASLYRNEFADQMIIFGGLSVSTNANARTAPSTPLLITEYNDVWRLSLSNDEFIWTSDRNVSESSLPHARSEAGTIIVGNKMYMFGGITYKFDETSTSKDFNDLWRYDLDTMAWEELILSDKLKPHKRFSHSMTLVMEKFLLVHSGRYLDRSSWNMLDDTWLYSIDENRWIIVQSSTKMPRMYTSMITIGRNDIWFFGGYYRSLRNMNGYVYGDTVNGELAIKFDDSFSVIEAEVGNSSEAKVTELASMRFYTAISAMGERTPPLRYNHRAVRWMDLIVLYGGSYQTLFGDVWMYDTTNAVLSQESDVMSKRITSLIYILSGLIAVILLMLILLLLRWRQLDRRALRSGGSRNTAIRGLSEERMQQLTITKYKKPSDQILAQRHDSSSSLSQQLRNNEGDSAIVDCIKNEDDVCPICLVEFEEDEDVRNLQCTHFFHVACIDEWLRRNATCPMCKDNVEPQLAAGVDTNLSLSRRSVVVPLLSVSDDTRSTLSEPRRANQVSPISTAQVTATRTPLVSSAMESS